MKLRNKLKSFAMDNHIKKYAEHNAKELENIADMFAVDFANWIVKNHIFYDESKKWQTMLDADLTSLELLYKFKQENKL